MTGHLTVSSEEWVTARKELLKEEKELSRLRDKVSAERRELPWVKVGKDYVFDTSAGKKALAELFDGHSQLIVYHFMFGPDWDAGCPSCSFQADHFDGANVHLAHHDVTLLAVSRAPLAKIEAYKNRMGWHFKWVSSYGSDFNYDFDVSFTKEEIETGKGYYNYEMIVPGSDELHGASVFYKDEKGDVFHTYSTYGRGLDLLLGTYNFLDLAPLGRQKYVTEFLRHDAYDK